MSKDFKNGAFNNGSFTNYVNRLERGGVTKMFTLLYKPYFVKRFTGGGGAKTGRNLVHVLFKNDLVLES